MPSLKNPLAEYDAQRVASMLISHGKDKANLIFKQISQRVSMKEFEAVIFSNRVFEIVKEKGVTNEN